VIEVAGHTSFKPYPKSTAGRRTVPLPGWLVTILRAHLDRYPLGEADLIFANEVGGALRRTLFRSRIWRPSLVRAGLLGTVVPDGDARSQVCFTRPYRSWRGRRPAWARELRRSRRTPRVVGPRSTMLPGGNADMSMPGRDALRPVGVDPREDLVERQHVAVLLVHIEEVDRTAGLVAVVGALLGDHDAVPVGRRLDHRGTYAARHALAADDQGVDPEVGEQRGQRRAPEREAATFASSPIALRFSLADSRSGTPGSENTPA
jgi:hypothetical protein